jgi:hypothetical protein
MTRKLCIGIVRQQLELPNRSTLPTTIPKARYTGWVAHEPASKINNIGRYKINKDVRDNTYVSHM